MGHVAGTKRFKDAMKLCVHGYAKYPCYRIKSWPNQRQRPESFVLLHRKKKRWQPSVAVLVLLLLTRMTWIERENCLLFRWWWLRSFCFYLDDDSLVFHLLALSFSCLSHRIWLSLKCAISIHVWLLFQEIWPLSTVFLAWESSSTDPILHHRPPFYVNDVVL